MEEKILKEKEQEFIQEGYTIFRKIYSQQDIAKISNITKSLINMAKEIDYPHDNKIHKINYHGTQFVIQSKDDNTIIHRIVWASGAKPELMAFSRTTELKYIIARLLQANQADHLINSIHPKLPNDQVEFKAHQDALHRRNFDPEWVNVNNDRSYAVCITAIDAMNKANGGISLIPGSHKVGKILSTEEINQLDFSGAFSPSLEQGDILCMHQYLVHFSLPNESNLPRNILINGFSVIGANHKPYPGEGSAELVSLIENNNPNSEDL